MYTGATGSTPTQPTQPTTTSTTSSTSSNPSLSTTDSQSRLIEQGESLIGDLGSSLFLTGDHAEDVLRFTQNSSNTTTSLTEGSMPPSTIPAPPPTPGAGPASGKIPATPPSVGAQPSPVLTTTPDAGPAPGRIPATPPLAGAQPSPAPTTTPGTGPAPGITPSPGAGPLTDPAAGEVLKKQNPFLKWCKDNPITLLCIGGGVGVTVGAICFVGALAITAGSFGAGAPIGAVLVVLGTASMAGGIACFYGALVSKGAIKRNNERKEDNSAEKDALKQFSDSLDPHLTPLDKATLIKLFNEGGLEKQTLLDNEKGYAQTLRDGGNLKMATFLENRFLTEELKRDRPNDYNSLKEIIEEIKNPSSEETWNDVYAKAVKVAKDHGDEKIQALIKQNKKQQKKLGLKRTSNGRMWDYIREELEKQVGGTQPSPAGSQPPGTSPSSSSVTNSEDVDDESTQYSDLTESFEEGEERVEDKRKVRFQVGGEESLRSEDEGEASSSYYDISVNSDDELTELSERDEEIELTEDEESDFSEILESFDEFREVPQGKSGETPTQAEKSKDPQLAMFEDILGTEILKEETTQAKPAQVPPASSTTSSNTVQTRRGASVEKRDIINAYLDKMIEDPYDTTLDAVMADLLNNIIQQAQAVPGEKK